MRLATMLFSLCATLAACASAPHVPPLDGTSWRLARFESPGAESAVLRPDDPQRFTLSFGQDGRIAARLDCNRAGGSWQAVPADTHGGGLRLGPLAMTRAMCPPDPIGERLSRDLESVTSYRLRDGRLHLSLPADAGVYVWERIAP